MASLISNRNSKKFAVLTGLALVILFFFVYKGPAESIQTIPEEAPVFGSGQSLSPTNQDYNVVGDEGSYAGSSKATQDAPAEVDEVADLLPTAAAAAVKSKSTAGAALSDDYDDVVPAKGAAKDSTKGSTKGMDVEDTSKSLYDSEEDSTAIDTKKTAAGEKTEQYVVMIDAGSTGSRVHVYHFDITVSPPKLLNEEFDMLKPGLSSFDEDAEGASESLAPLLKFAMKYVPKNMQACTPIAVKATAGLRLLGTKKSNAILAQVEADLKEKYPFPVVENGVVIMDGSDEGVYAWITTNYLLGNIGGKAKTPTAAVFDLGGGSTQIVFEPTSGESMIEGEHKYEISFGGRDFILYQYSHLGYGLMQGRNKVNALVIETMLKDKTSKSTLTPLTAFQKKDDTLEATVDVIHPCVPPGVTAANVKVQIDEDTTYLVNFVSPSTSIKDAETESTQCRFLVESILNKDLECESKSCSFNGIYQPSLNNQFSKTSDMFVFSYFYDRIQPLGMPLTFTLEEMKDINKLVCSGSEFWSKAFEQKESVTELESEPLWCLDLSFMTSLLHVGYDIPLARELKTAKKIADNELGWCLGASLPLIDQKAGWSCNVVKDF